MVNINQWGAVEKNVANGSAVSGPRRSTVVVAKVIVVFKSAGLVAVR